MSELIIKDKTKQKNVLFSNFHIRPIMGHIK